GVQSSAVEVVFWGADRGGEADHPEPMAFARGLPLAKAMDADTILATRMNGEILDASHGYPIRLLAPGWYGVASVKWLTRIEVIDRPFQGYYQTKKYVIQRRLGQSVETVLVSSMAVKSEILRSASDAVF